MSYIGDTTGVTSTEVEGLANLIALDSSSATQAIRKTGVNTFANVEISQDGAIVFTDLTDVPNTYVNQKLKGIRVNATANGLEFYTTTDVDEKVKYNVGDPTAGYVADKIVAGTGISVAEGTGGNENKLVINSTITQATRDSLGLDTDDTVTFGNLSGTNTGDQVGDGVTITGAGTVGDPFVSSGGGLSESLAIAFAVAL